MAPPRLEISPIKSIEELETCVPNLMPFHIDYNGKAPMSTYLRVEPASEVVGAPEPEPEPAKSDSNIEPKLQEKLEVSSLPEPTDEKSPAVTLAGPSSPSFTKRVRDTATRFISTFRGRTIQGLKVDLPPGYVGLVLKADTDDVTDKKRSRDDREKKSKAYGKRRAKPASTTGRVTRSNTRVIDVDEEMDVDMADGTEESRNEEEPGAPPDQITTRTLVPISQFSNFIIWNPDMPVDATRDEYIRSLTEWTQLAHEIHKAED